jgi:putative ABC transport system permease protein
VNGFLLRLALRNLLRQRRRTLLSMVAIVAGVATLIVGRGFLGGLTENFVRSQIDAVSGHLVVRPAGYASNGLSHPVDGAFSFDEAEATLGDAAAWAPRLMFAPTLVFEGDSVRARAIGYDKPRDEAVFSRNAWRIEGSEPESGEGLLLSSGLASLLDVHVDDVVTLQTRTVGGAINAAMFTVTGVVATGNPYLDQFGVLVPLADADALLAAGGRATHLAVRMPTRDVATAESLGARVAAVLAADVEASTWYAETEDVRRIQSIRQRALDLIVFALLGISATGIANTVLMAAFERVREIGTLRAMGMTRVGVLQMFLLEGAMLGLAGATVGCVLGIAIVGWFSVYGIDLSSVVERAGGNLPISAVLYAVVDRFWIGVAFVFGFGTSILASFLPARIASRLVPAEAARAA